MAAPWRRERQMDGPEGHLHVVEAGQGPCPVVLLTGLGVPAHLWWEADGWEEDLSDLIQDDVWGDRPFLAPLLVPLTRVVSYDRAGMGGSTAPTQTRTLDGLLAELRAVIRATARDQSVLLVGHSLGGLIALAHAQRCPGQVAGLVMLDSSHPHQLSALASLLSPEQQQAEAETRERMRAEHPERPDLDLLLNQGKDAFPAGCLGDLPLQVLSRGNQRYGPKQQRLVPDQSVWAAQQEVWQGLQLELAQASTRGQQILALQSDHYVHFNQPEFVASMIRELWSEVNP